jgi:hypothetical protein
MKMFKGQMEIKGEYTINGGVSSDGREYIGIYDENENEVYYEDERGFWHKKEFYRDGKKIYEENSNRGIIYDVRPRAGESIKTDNDDTNKLVECNFCHRDNVNTDRIFIGGDVNGDDIICEDCIKKAMEKVIDKQIEKIADMEKKRVSESFEEIFSGKLI